MAETEARRMFAVLVREYHRRCLAYAMSLNPDRGIAEDIVQEAFIAAYRNFGRFDHERDFGAWMRGIIRMKYLEFSRRSRNVPVGDEIMELLEKEYAQWDEARRTGNVEDMLEAVRQCMKKLPDTLGGVLSAFYFRQISCREIEAETGVCEVTIRQRLNRARHSLRECLGATLKAGLSTGESV